MRDLEAWPARGLVVLDGPTVAASVRVVLVPTGLAAALEDLDTWLRRNLGL